MASLDTTAPPHVTTEKPPKSVQQQYKGSWGPALDAALRMFLFATAMVAVIIMAASKQTKLISLFPGFAIPLEAKFTQSPAFIYAIAALSVACLYSIITGVLSVFALMKPGGSWTKLQFHFVIFDALLLGIVAAATGAAGGVAYIGLKGNSHTNWNKVCDQFSSFCSHLAGSIVLSLVSSITLLLLVWLSIYVLSKKLTRG
ncbi:CASP-like protein 1 [Lactuca sativa]|uniref:CASP-like protein n=1 Tax=Lactuca sativa TaxID=4236 RepID=A0A9R1VL33_LACSA|nr:CASP-like protein 1 [Lactuca sativa]KAJ0208235.1 hypothetical protein LSAT_V11C500246950 [Lactuca sativa]